MSSATYIHRDAEHRHGPWVVIAAREVALCRSQIRRIGRNIQILFSVDFAEPGERIQAVMKKISIV
jgi:hypothetical protein